MIKNNLRLSHIHLQIIDYEFFFGGRLINTARLE